MFTIGDRHFRWEDQTSSNLSCLTLRDLSNAAVLKNGLERGGLPRSLIDELEVLDQIIKWEMSGLFINIGEFYRETKLSIDWSI